MGCSCHRRRLLVMRPVGEWLRRRRRALDLTQAALADGAGCVPGTIKSIEADARCPSRQLAERLADVLELLPDERAAFLKAARAESVLTTWPPPLNERRETSAAQLRPRRPMLTNVRCRQGR